MRLTTEQISIIRETVAEIFGPSANVRLFGSRIDDDTRGGDIDLYIEANGKPAELLDRELQLGVRLMRRLGDRRIDVIVHANGQPLRPIDRHAQQTGITL